MIFKLACYMQREARASKQARGAVKKTTDVPTTWCGIHNRGSVSLSLYVLEIDGKRVCVCAITISDEFYSPRMMGLVKQAS